MWAKKGGPPKKQKFWNGFFRFTYNTQGNRNSNTACRRDSDPRRIYMSESNARIVVLNSSRFGQGNPRLGESLMEDFLDTLAKSVNVPQAILLYNSAVVLACKDSKLLKPLKALADLGCKVLVNEESLVFYSLAANLECGEPTSLKDMTESMMEADAVIKP